MPSDLPLCCWWLIWPIQNDAKKLRNDWNPGKWVYSSERTQWELSNEYQHDRVKIVFKDFASLYMEMNYLLCNFHKILSLCFLQEPLLGPTVTKCTTCFIWQTPLPSASSLFFTTSSRWSHQSKLLATRSSHWATECLLTWVSTW